MRIAIVGAGISGLVVAHLLDREHEVTVFEAADYAGGHTNTIRVDTPNETHEVDTGFIVFNDRNYPNFERLLERLGVAWQPSTMSFSVSDGIGDFEYSGGSANALFANRRHLLTPWFHRMVTDLARFNRAARELLVLEDAGRGPSLGRLARAPALLPRVHRSADRSPGVGRVVGRSAPDVELPGPLPGRVLRPPRDARVPRSPAVANGPGRLEAVRRGAAGPIRRPAAAGHAGARDHPRRGPRARAPGRRRGRAVRRGRARDALRPGARAARGRSAIANGRSSARSPTSTTRPCSTPTCACCRAGAARGRAGTTTCSPSRRAARPSPTT